jgi:hypothetical protein
MELRITKDRVIEAANECPDATKVLKTLFPEAFSKKLQVGYYKQSSDLHALTIDNQIAIQLRTIGRLADKSLFLSNLFTWRLEQDEFGITCLIPTKK